MALTPSTRCDRNNRHPPSLQDEESDHVSAEECLFCLKFGTQPFKKINFGPLLNRVHHAHELGPLLQIRNQIQQTSQGYHLVDRKQTSQVGSRIQRSNKLRGGRWIPQTVPHQWRVSATTPDPTSSTNWTRSWSTSSTTRTSLGCLCANSATLQSTTLKNKSTTYPKS